MAYGIFEVVFKTGRDCPPVGHRSRDYRDFDALRRYLVDGDFKRAGLCRRLAVWRGLGVQTAAEGI